MDLSQYSDEQLLGMLQQHAAPQVSPQQEMVAQDKYEMNNGLSGAAKQLGAYGMNAIQGLPGGTFSDELASGVGAAFGGGEGQDFGSRYENLQQRQQAFRQAGREIQPEATAMGTVGSALASAPLMPGAGPAKTLIGAMAKSGATGLAYGTAAGAGEGNAFADSKDSAVQRIMNAGGGALAGGVLGAAVPAVGAGANKMAQSLGWADEPIERMTAEELRKVGSDTFKLAEQQGGLLPSRYTNAFLDDLAAVKPQGKLGTAIAGENEVTKLVDRLEAVRNHPISLSDAMEGDKELNTLIDKFVDKTTGKMSDEGRRLYEIQTKFRDMIKSANPYDMQNGIEPSKEGFSTWEKGKELWAAQARLRDVEKIIDRAKLMDNPVTGLKTGFRNLYLNKARMNGFDNEEKAAIKAASETGLATNILRMFGSRLAPIGSAVAGGAAGGLPGAAISGLASEAVSGTARNLATKMQMNKANSALDLISGHSAPPVDTGFPITAGGTQGLAEFMRQQ